MSEDGENESGVNENSEWDEHTKGVNIENDDDINKDEEAIEEEQEIPVDVQGTQAPVGLDPEKKKTTLKMKFRTIKNNGK